jgi:Protein of unknown function (DUF3347)
MKRIFILLAFLAASFGVYWFFVKSKTVADAPKQQAITLKKHSENFNKSVATTMAAYFSMKAAFVEGDTAAVKLQCKNFITQLDNISLDELKKDTASIFETANSTREDIKSNATSLLTQTDITEMRKDFGMVSKMMYPAFFKTINYEGEKLYWQECGMAYGADKPDNWISNTKEIINPYMGKNHPQYKGGMLSCGELKDTINPE